jgi:hypothetical protein
MRLRGRYCKFASVRLLLRGPSPLPRLVLRLGWGSRRGADSCLRCQQVSVTSCAGIACREETVACKRCSVPQISMKPALVRAVRNECIIPRLPGKSLLWTSLPPMSTRSVLIEFLTEKPLRWNSDGKMVKSVSQRVLGVTHRFSHVAEEVLRESTIMGGATVPCV